MDGWNECILSQEGNYKLVNPTGQDKAFMPDQHDLELLHIRYEQFDATKGLIEKVEKTDKK